ncbi:MAG: hypothetical protein ILP23_08050 [Paludibacteraceae bacterium]|nr:hypothetical protein [Paludibacteraceae bacterium]
MARLQRRRVFRHHLHTRYGAFFGEIADGEMRLTEIGLCAEEQLRNVSSHYQYAEIPLWVVMPNHIHAIVMIDGDKTPHEKRNTARMVQTGRAPSVCERMKQTDNCKDFYS